MLKIIKEKKGVYTNRLVLDILMKDLTARKIEINFNGWEDWDEGSCPLIRVIGFIGS